MESIVNLDGLAEYQAQLLNVSQFKKLFQIMEICKHHINVQLQIQPINVDITTTLLII